MISNLLSGANDKLPVAKGDDEPSLKADAGNPKGNYLTRNWLLTLALVFLTGLVIAAAVIIPTTLTHHSRDDKVRQRSVPLDPNDQIGAGVDGRGSEESPARMYYIQAELVNWNYQPLGRDLCAAGPAKPSAVDNPVPRWKAVYRQYTDGTFKTAVPRTQDDVHLGLLGPYIRAEAGTTIAIVFRNNASIPVNMEPSGLLYEPPTLVNPGDTVTYMWGVPLQAAPGPDETTTSALWLYRSTVHVTADLNAGLMGPIIVTRKGEADADGRPRGVDRELVAVLQIMDEANALHTIMSRTMPGSVRGAPSDEEKHHTINGLINCNSEGFNVSYGAKVRFYVGALGNEADVHTIHWHGVTLEKEGHRVDQVVLVAGSTAALDFHADNPGAWFMHCHVNDHLVKGMKAHLTISEGPRPTPIGTIRQHYVAAEVVEWDYAPQGKDLCSGKPEPFSEDAEVFLKPGPNRIGRKYLKARYIEYTDATFTTKKPISEVYKHLGIQGPVLRAEVGDTIQVLFKNMVPNHALSMHPHGVLYAKHSEGALYGDYTSGADKSDDGVLTNETHMYQWMVPERTGPGPADPNSIVWLYHSHVDEVAETYAGLYGAIVVGRKGEMNEAGQGLAAGVDREVLAVFVVTNEVKSFLFNQNMARYLNVTDPDAISELVADEDFEESNLMHNINGYMYCNLPGLEVQQGGTLRWYLMAYGNEVDMHTPHMSASQFKVGRRRHQSMRLLPGSMTQADMTPLAPGIWPLVCHVNDHISAGMKALYRVTDQGKLVDAVTGVTRSYFIQAEELMWDYTPLGYDGCSGRQFDEDQQVFLTTSEKTLGSKYRKAVFRGYADATFKQHTSSPSFMGVLGPTIRAEVGDKLEVMLKNSATFPVSLELAGGLLPLNMDSAPIEPVAPGSSKTYTFVVPADAAPGEGSTSGVAAYMYLSGQNVVADSYAGLVGVMLVGAQGTFSGPDGMTKGVDMELPVLFSVIDENQSPFLAANIQAQQQASGIKAINTTHEDFEESNKMHSINGYMYCNMPQPSLPANSKVLVVLMGLGTEVDMHGPVFTGQDLQSEGQPLMAPVLMPATVEVGLLTVSAEVGSWEFYCLVSDHYAAGMRAKLGVTPAGRKLLRQESSRKLHR